LEPQATVETTTYGSEFVAAHIATHQVIDLCNTLHWVAAAVVVTARGHDAIGVRL